jgi:hypothetical protein
MSEKHPAVYRTDISTVLRDALSEPDHGREEMGRQRFEAKRNAWNATPDAIQSSAELLMRNLVVGAHEIGVKRVHEATGTVYSEILTLADRISGQTQPTVEDVDYPEMSRLQHDLNARTISVLPDSEPGDRAQLIDALVFANEQLLCGDESAALTAGVNESYYIGNLAAGIRQLQPQT